MTPSALIQMRCTIGAFIDAKWMPTMKKNAASIAALLSALSYNLATRKAETSGRR
jgi:hypothetical protein